MRKSTLLLIIALPFLLSGVTSPNDKKNYKEGELIIQLFGKAETSTMTASDRLMHDFRDYDLQAVRLLSDRMNVWLFSYDPMKTSDNALLNSIRKHEAVSLAQFNHRIEQRETIPSDPYFDDQWALKNTGQGGGVPDADIDATDAWDITTGGTTATGEEIIIAVIDGGAYLTHEDLNFWKNEHEIPNNGIDDDNNGYVDDYDGWNSYNHSGNIGVDDHGTHVIGICAAKGDNDKGVCGINWNTKVMPIAGSSTWESVAVESYGYVLEMRATYNETNGDYGAFVVVTNSSFGVDAGQPEDYPIWCAMYDSMGMQGVLSAAATANKNWNIDETGDVPTACGSDFIISVTNTTSSDEKNTWAGYGLTTIDLGAPGSQIMSTRINNGYGNKSGTSMATPQVAGAVALLFAAADETFMNAYKNNLEEYSLKIKQYILDGVDILPTLVNKSVTGGRLNVFNSINILQDPPVMAALPDSLIQVMKPDTFDSTYLLMTNTGGSMLNYDLTINDQPEWLVLGNKEGSVAAGETDSVKVYFDTDALAQGDYFSKIHVVQNYYTFDSVAIRLTVSNTAGIYVPVGSASISGIAARPNPFRTSTEISFTSRDEDLVKLEIFNHSGRLVRDLGDHICLQGANRITWDGKDDSGSKLVPGVYFCKITGNKSYGVIRLLIL